MGHVGSTSSTPLNPWRGDVSARAQLGGRQTGSERSVPFGQEGGMPPHFPDADLGEVCPPPRLLQGACPPEASVQPGHREASGFLSGQCSPLTDGVGCRE